MATVKKLSETVYEVSATRSGEELKHLKKHVLVHFKDAKVDGFRKGHVPADVLEKKFKKEIEGEILGKDSYLDLAVIRIKREDFIFMSKNIATKISTLNQHGDFLLFSMLC